MKKAAFITGASGGIGSAVALRLARDGFEVACCYNSDEEGIKGLAEKLKKEDAVFSIFRMDVSDTNETEKIFREASEQHGGFSVLVNCAGTALQKLMTDTTSEEFDRICGTDFKGVYNLCHAAVPYMVKNHCGRIINISSMWGVTGASCETVYSGAKAAVIGFTKALARELAPSGINVNCIAPGAIDTKMNDILTDEEKAEFAEQIPMGRFGTPDEIAGVVSFLAGADSSYVTAQVITVDGGLT